MASREQVLAYRAAVSGLSGHMRGVDRVLDVGAQDHPTGQTARLALRLRDATAEVGEAHVHSVRAATHVHRRADLGLLSAALRIEDGRDLAKASIGPFGEEIGDGFGEAIDDVASVMADVMSDGAARTKGELSGAASPHVDRRLAPWCGGCGTHHVQDALFRYATLRAGLVIEVESPTVFRFLPPVETEPVDTELARVELIRRFLRAAGPATPARLAAWLGLTPAAARRWWALVADELEQVSVDGRKAWARADDLALLVDPPPPDGIRLLGPYDPLTETADRELAVPTPADRRRVWAAVGNPGIILVDGEIAGVWRRKASKEKLTLTVTPFGSLPRNWRTTAEADTRIVGDFFGARDVAFETT